MSYGLLASLFVLLLGLQVASDLFHIISSAQEQSRGMTLGWWAIFYCIGLNAIHALCSRWRRDQYHLKLAKPCSAAYRESDHERTHTISSAKQHFIAPLFHLGRCEAGEGLGGGNFQLKTGNGTLDFCSP